MTKPKPKVLMTIALVALCVALAWLGFWLDGVYHDWRWPSVR